MKDFHRPGEKLYPGRIQPTFWTGETLQSVQIVALLLDAATSSNVGQALLLGHMHDQPFPDQSILSICVRSTNAA